VKTEVENEWKSLSVRHSRNLSSLYAGGRSLPQDSERNKKDRWGMNSPIPAYGSFILISRMMVIFYAESKASI